jgi:hypothetical protein
MLYPNLIIERDIGKELDSSFPGFILKGVNSETEVFGESYSGRKIYMLSGNCHYQITNPSELDLDSNVFTIEYLLSPSINSSAIIYSDGGYPRSGIAIGLSAQKISITRGATFTTVLVDSVKLPSTPFGTFNHYVLRVNGNLGSIVYNGTEVLTFTVPARSTGNPYILGNTTDKLKNNKQFNGLCAGIALHGGSYIPVDSFYFKPKAIESSTVLLSKATKGINLNNATPAMINSAEVQDADVVFKFTNNKHFRITRPALTTDGVLINSIEPNGLGELIVTDSENSEYNLGVVPESEGSAFDWYPGTGYLVPDGLTFKYLPLTAGNGIRIVELSDSFYITTAAQEGVSVSFLNKVTLVRSIPISTSYVGSITANTWTMYPFTKLLTDSVNVNNYSQGASFIMPVGRYYVQGSLTIAGCQNSKVRIQNLDDNSTIAEADSYALNTASSTVFPRFNDVFELLVPTNIAVQFISTASASLTNTPTTLSMPLVTTAQLNFYKV